jgi:hypothetical protein
VKSECFVRLTSISYHQLCLVIAFTILGKKNELRLQDGACHDLQESEQLQFEFICELKSKQLDDDVHLLAEKEITRKGRYYDTEVTVVCQFIKISKSGDQKKQIL